MQIPNSGDRLKETRDLMGGGRQGTTSQKGQRSKQQLKEASRPEEAVDDGEGAGAVNY